MKWSSGFSLGALACTASIITGCSGEVFGVEYGGAQFEERIRVGDRLRDYVVYVPPSASPDTPAPLMMVFHGATMSAETMLLLSWFNPVADREGFVVAYLAADGDAWATGGASPLDAERVDDLGFVDAVIARLDSDLNLDRGRVYAVGYSNGALFSQRLACQRSQDIAAIGVVGASVSIPVVSGCNPLRPVPAIFILGDRDPSFPWGDAAAVPQGLMGGEASATFWSDIAACDPEWDITALPDVVADDTTVERWDFPTCAPDGDMAFYRVRRGGHTWPGSPLNLSPGLGRKSRDLDASPVIAEFLLRQSAGPR